MPHGLRAAARLYLRVRGHRPRAALEIGTAQGGTFFLLSRAAANDATLVSLGLPPWELDDPGEDARRQALTGFARAGQTVRVIRHDALSPAGRAEAHAALGGEALDVLVVTNERHRDRRDAVLRAWGPLVGPGGLVVWDESLPGKGPVLRFREVPATSGPPRSPRG